jgi:serine/threonine protein kinase
VSSQLGTELKRSKYRLLGLVGQGQFGRVYCATHRQTGRLVALKNLEQQRFPTHKFLRELRFLLSLQHPNIVTCQALEHTATGRYLVMDYCEGGTLRSLMSEDSRLSLSQSLKLVADILAGLEHAHSRGIVHCDIKPENILLNLHPTGWIARISDFGIARLSQELTEQETGNTGSPAYMAPERFYGQYSQTSDLYSVGIILFELLAGHRPFSGTPAELMSAHLNHPVNLPDTVPEIWRPLVMTALQKLSGRRFRSAKDMLASLKAIAATPGSGSWLDPQTGSLPLLTPQEELAVCPFKFERQYPLQQPIHDLAVATQLAPGSCTQSAIHLYQAEAGQVRAAQYSLTDSSQTTTFHLPISAQQLLLRPQGCFAIAQDAVYLLPSSADAAPQLIAQFEKNSVVAIEATGHWLAVASTAPMGISTLTLQPLPGNAVSVAAQPISLAVRGHAGGQVTQLLQAIALDTHHVAIVAALAKGKEESSATLLEVFTRRGNRVGSLVVPLPIAHNRSQQSSINGAN